MCIRRAEILAVSLSVTPSNQPCFLSAITLDLQMEAAWQCLPSWRQVGLLPDLVLKARAYLLVHRTLPFCSIRP